MTVALSRVRLALPAFTLEVDGELARGWTGLVGPSGAGKTSLLELIAGFRRPDAGSIAIHGVPVFDSEERVDVSARSRGVGYVTQDDTLFPHLPVRGNLVPDAHLAALLRQHGIRTLYTNDSDFRKFSFLDVRNPFATA